MKMTITPIIANEMLSKNTGNRKLNVMHVNRLADEMRGDNWVFTGETITFDSNDVLTDGQHRLHAVIKSGVHIEVEVISGVDNTSFGKVNCGLARTATQVVAMHGFKNTNFVAAVSKILVGIDNYIGEMRDFKVDSKKVPNHTILEKAHEIQAALEAMDLYNNMRKSGATAAESAALMYIYDVTGDFDTVSMIAKKLGDGLFSSANDPLKVLRDFLQRSKGRSGCRVITIRMAYMIKVYNAVKRGKSLSRLSWSEATFPKIVTCKQGR